MLAWDSNPRLRTELGVALPCDDNAFVIAVLLDPRVSPPVSPQDATRAWEFFNKL
jgi:hypothetical protein